MTFDIHNVVCICKTLCEVAVYKGCSSFSGVFIYAVLICLKSIFVHQEVATVNESVCLGINVIYVCL